MMARELDNEDLYGYRELREFRFHAARLRQGRMRFRGPKVRIAADIYIYIYFTCPGVGLRVNRFSLSCFISPPISPHCPSLVQYPRRPNAVDKRPYGLLNISTYRPRKPFPSLVLLQRTTCICRFPGWIKCRGAKIAAICICPTPPQSEFI